MPRDAQIIFRAEVAVKERLQALADKEGVSFSDLVRRYLTLLTEVPQETVDGLLKASEAVAAQIDKLGKHLEDQTALLAKKTATAEKAARLVVEAESAYEMLKARWTYLKSQTVAVEAGIKQAEETLKGTGRHVAIKIPKGGVPEVEVQ